MHKVNTVYGFVVAGLFFVNSALAGGVEGTVKFEGAVPQMKPLDMGADPDCQAKHSSPALAEALVLGNNNAMANVFVQVKSGLPNKKYDVPKDPIIVAQEGCIYHPHVFGMLAGQTLKFMNNDGVLHNVHALPKVNQQFNLGMPPTMKEAEKTFTEVEPMFFVKCDVHPWMGAYGAVMSHPFFAVTGTDGKFLIKGLDPGTYEIEAWHEKLGTKTATVTVGASDTKTADFTFQRPTS